MRTDYPYHAFAEDANRSFFLPVKVLALEPKGYVVAPRDDHLSHTTWITPNVWLSPALYYAEKRKKPACPTAP